MEQFNVYFTKWRKTKDLKENLQYPLNQNTISNEQFLTSSG